MPDIAPEHERARSADIDERTRIEAALRQSEERFRALVTATSDVVYRVSPDWTEMRYLRGRDFIPDTESPNRTWLDKYIHPDDQPHVMAAINEAIRTKSIFELEHRVVRVDGTLGWTFSRAVPLLDDNGEILEWFGAASDISQRKYAEEALRQSERRYRAYFNLPITGIAITSSDKKWVEVNPALCDLLGYTREELISKTWSELTFPEDREPDFAQFRRVLAGEIDGYALEKRFIRKDQSIIWVDLSGNCVRSESGEVA